MRWLPALLVLALVGGCTTAPPDPVVVTVLAGSELADLRHDTGVELELDYRGTVRAGEELAAGTGHDLAWLATNRYLRLRGADVPLSTSTMLSPLVLGVKAGRAAAGELRFAMADPRGPAAAWPR